MVVRANIQHLWLKIEKREIIKIISNLGFKINENKENLDLEIPSWRPDITQPIDIVEEIVRIKGYEHIQTLTPEKSRLKPTLNRQQKLFHFLQRSVASKGFYETVTWSFTDSKINNLFSYNQITDLSPIAFLPDLEILDLEHNLIDSGKFLFKYF